MYIGIKEIISKCNFWILQWLRKPNAACLHQPLPKWTWYFCLLATTCKSGVDSLPGLGNHSTLIPRACYSNWANQSPSQGHNIQTPGMKLSSLGSLNRDGKGPSLQPPSFLLPEFAGSENKVNSLKKAKPTSRNRKPWR